MTVTTGYHFLCDPEYMVTAQADAVDLALKMIQTNTTRQCYSSSGTSESFIVAVALVDRIRIPDLSGTSCINTCGELYPTLDTSVRSPTDAEKSAAMENFANYLRSGWDLGSCENDVIIFYSQNLSMVHVSVGERATSVVTSDVVTSIKSTFLSYKQQGRLGEGLLVIAEELRLVLRGVTAAHVLLIVNMITLVAFGAFLIAFLQFRNLDYNVWGREKFWKGLEIFFYVISGVWLINGLLYGVIYVSNKAPYWAILIAGFFGMACIVLYVFEGQLFPSSTNSGSYNLTSQ